MTTVQTLLEDVEYGIASGNYDGSSQDFYSNVVPAANYYGGQGSLQTITYKVVGFTGMITLEATLDNNAESANYFEVDEYDAASTIITDLHPVNVTGNFVYLRAHVTNFDAGTIDFVTATY